MKTKIPPGLFPPQQYAKILLGVSRGTSRNEFHANFFRCTVVSSGGFLYLEGFRMPPEELTERCQPLRKSNMIGIAHTVVQHIRDSGLRLEKVVNGFEFNYLKQTIIGCDSVSEDDFRFMRELIERNFSRGRKKQKEMVLFGQLN